MTVSKNRFANVGQRMALSLRKQNWTGYALEFVIVVLGVFIGIQVSNWNESRLEDRQRAEVYEALQSEFELNIADLRSRYDRDLARTAVEHDLSQALLDGEIDAGEAPLVQTGMAQIMYFSPVVIPNNTMESLRQSGELSLIDDPEVLGSLIEFAASVEWIEGQHNSFRGGISDLQPEWRDYVFHSATDDPRQTSVEVDVPGLVADHRARSAFSQVVRMKSIFLNYLPSLIERAEETCALLAEETGRPCEASDEDQ